MHRGKVDPGVSELPRGNELSRDHVNRPLLLQVLFLMIGDMTSFYNNLIFIATSGPANYELLSYQYIGCASQVLQLVYQIHKLQFRVPKPLDHCAF